MKNKKIWIALIVLLILAGTAFFFRERLGLTESQATAAREQTETETVAIRPATDSLQVSASGNIALASQQAVVFQVEGVVTEVAVKPGDTVSTGDLLVALETGDLERAVDQAELELKLSQTALEKLTEAPDPAAIASAQASLVAAQESLAQLEAGPRAAELAAAQASLAAAQASYEEVKAGATEAELTQLSAELHKAFITLKQAQEAYNEIAYTDTVGSSQQAMTLQEATIDYDTAKAAYEIATAPATPAELQEALSTIQTAQSQLEALSSTQADLASAKATVASAEATLADLLNGPTPAERREAELNIEQAQLNLAEAAANLAQARLRATGDGTILSVEVEVGQQVTSGLSVATMADLTALELPVNVAEVDISKVELGQPATITLDALPDETFKGVVSRIAPTSQADSGVVNYEVTIRLDGRNLESVRPGMTAVATLSDDNAAAGWLVPTNALVEAEGETTLVLVRNGQRTRIDVTPGSAQGEWTVVESPDLQAGDRVVGSVASFLDEDEGSNQGPRGPFGPPPR